MTARPVTDCDLGFEQLFRVPVRQVIALVADVGDDTQLGQFKRGVAVGDVGLVGVGGVLGFGEVVSCPAAGVGEPVALRFCLIGRLVAPEVGVVSHPFPHLPVGFVGGMRRRGQVSV